MSLRLGCQREARASGYHKYNHEINNIYYCADNCIIENGRCKHYKPSRYLVADYFIIDAQTKTVDLLPSSNITDYFTTQFYAVEKIEYEKGEDGGKVVNIYQNDGNLIKIEVNKYKQLPGGNYLLNLEVDPENGDRWNFSIGFEYVDVEGRLLR